MLTGEEHCGRLTLDGHLDPTCGCFEEGYALGKKKLEMELESWKPGTHLPGCGCLPCRLFRSWVDLNCYESLGIFIGGGEPRIHIR